MVINYNKYINSTGTHYIANSGSDSKGGISGDKAGDQNGKEWVLRSWYNRPWSCVLRHPDPKVRRLIAELGIEGALNDLIGYDQGQRTTFWSQLKVSGYRPANIKTACEQDCSAGSSSCVKAAGYLLGIKKLQDVYAYNNSSTIKADLKKAGFEVLSESKYRTSGKYLLPGDILLYESHHVAINVTRGAKATGEVASSVDTPSTSYKLGDRALKDGMSGPDVKELQEGLISLGYDCGPDGADGDFGPNTALAVKAFQTVRELKATGQADAATIAALVKALNLDPDATVPAAGARVVVANCSQCNIRCGPGKSYKSIGKAVPGDTFTAADGNLPDGDGWVPVVCWISPKYARKEGT